MTESQSQSLDTIARSVQELTVLAQALSDGLQQQITRAGVIQRWIAGVVIVLVLFGGVIGFQVAELKRLTLVAAANRADITTNQEHIAGIQRTVNAEVLCPLFVMFLRSHRPEHPEAQRDPQAYEEAFEVLEHGATTLGCAQTRRGRQ